MTQDQAASGALIVDSPDDVVWNDTADIVIVGFGAAGAVSAIQATECGASAIVIDRFAGGGATAYSGGIIYAGGTPFQKAAGFDDTPDDLYAYLQAEGSAVEDETLRRFCEGSAADIEWLSALGITYGSRLFSEKTAYPPDGYDLYFSGNEKMPRMIAQARPAPRGHRPVVPGFGGAYFYQKLRAATLERGVKLIEQAPVSRLVLDRDGRVIGVEIQRIREKHRKRHMALYRVVYPWRPFNSDRAARATKAAIALERDQPTREFVRAHNAVILATGGFNNNVEMLSQHRPVMRSIFKYILRLGSMGDSGFGIKLAEAAGGTTARMGNITVGRRVLPPYAFGNGVVVNQKGERFVSESANVLIIGSKILDQPGTKAWLIVQADDFWAGFRELLSQTKVNFLAYTLPVMMNLLFGGTRRATSLKRLAEKLGCDPAAVSRTVAEFNVMATSDRRDPFDKLDELIKPLIQGPFYAINLSLDNKIAPAFMITLGGLRLEERTGLVIREDGSTIGGLYAAGRVASGLCSNGYHMSGYAIADAVFSGRRAGRSAASAR